MLYLYDKNEELLRIIPKASVKSAIATENAKSPWTVDVLLKLGADISNAVYVAYKDVINPETLRYYKIIRQRLNESGIVMYGLETAYDDLEGDGYIVDQRPTGKPLNEVVATILDGSRWTCGNVPSVSVTTNFYYISRLEALQKVCELYDLELRPRITHSGSVITGRYIDIVTSEGVDRGKRFTHGDKLLTVLKEEDKTAIYTAMVGRGKGEAILDEGGAVSGYGRRIMFDDVVWSVAEGDPVDKPPGQKHVEVPSLTVAFGYPDGKPRIGIKVFEDCTDAAELLQITYDYVIEQGRPKVYYRASVHDEGATGLGDLVTIIRDDFGIRYKTRIIKREVDLLNPNSTKIEFGDVPVNYVAQAFSSIKQVIEIETQNRITDYETLIGIIESQYWGEDGYNYDIKIGNEYGLPAGFYSFDKPIDQNPTKFVYVGAGKIIISNEKDSGGNWVIKTFMDGDGLAANTVTGVSIVSESIGTDHISASGIDAEKIVLSDETDAETRIMELLAGQIKMEESIEGSGENLIKNPTFGSTGAPSTEGWHNGFTMGAYLDRFGWMTMAQMLEIFGDRPFQDFLNFNWW